MDIQFRGNTLSGDPAKHISYAVFINQQNKTLYVGCTKYTYVKKGIYPNDTITFIGATNPDTSSFINPSHLKNYSFSHFMFTDSKTKFRTNEVYAKSRGITYEIPVTLQPRLTASNEAIHHYQNALQCYEKANTIYQKDFDDTSFATNMRSTVDQLTKSLVEYYQLNENYQVFINTQKIPSDTLYNRISFLHAQNYITSSQRSLFHDIRLNCNNASHGESVHISKTIAKTWLDRMDMTLQSYQRDFTKQGKSIDKKNLFLFLLFAILLIALTIYLIMHL